MKVRDEFTGMTYDMTLNDAGCHGTLHLANNGYVAFADLAGSDLELAREAVADRDVVLAEALIRMNPVRREAA